MSSAIALLFLVFPLIASDFSYAYVRQESDAMISRGSLREVLRLRERLSGEFLWAKVGRREYVIRDAAVLSEVRKAFEPLDALIPHQKALHAKTRPLERRIERLEREADALSDADELRREQKARLRELESALRALELEMRPFEEEERKLDLREEALEKVFDAEVERIVRQSIRSGVASRLR